MDKGTAKLYLIIIVATGYPVRLEALSLQEFTLKTTGGGGGLFVDLPELASAGLITIGLILLVSTRKIT